MNNGDVNDVGYRMLQVREASNWVDENLAMIRLELVRTCVTEVINDITVSTRSVITTVVFLE